MLCFDVVVTVGGIMCTCNVLLCRNDEGEIKFDGEQLSCDIADAY